MVGDILYVVIVVRVLRELMFCASCSSDQTKCERARVAIARKTDVPGKVQHMRKVRPHKLMHK